MIRIMMVRLPCIGLLSGDMWLPWSTLNRHRRMRHITLAEVREMITSSANWNYRNQEPYILTRWQDGEEWYKAADKAVYYDQEEDDSEDEEGWWSG